MRLIPCPPIGGPNVRHLFSPRHRTGPWHPGRELSAVEVMEAHIAQMKRVNPALNAVVTFLPEQALEKAQAADAALDRGEMVGPLHGLPMLHKDTNETTGIRTTYGSPIFRDNVPAHRTALLIERAHQAGAIPLGKTDVPGVQHRFPELQPGLWRHPQPL